MAYVEMKRSDFKETGKEYSVIDSQCTKWTIEKLGPSVWFVKNKTAYVGGGKVYTDFDNMKNFICGW